MPTDTTIIPSDEFWGELTFDEMAEQFPDDPYLCTLHLRTGAARSAR